MEIYHLATQMYVVEQLAVSTPISFGTTTAELENL
jgi:hypothetical protein